MQLSAKRSRPCSFKKLGLGFQYAAHFVPFNQRIPFVLVVWKFLFCSDTMHMHSLFYINLSLILYYLKQTGFCTRFNRIGLAFCYFSTKERTFGQELLKPLLRLLGLEDGHFRCKLEFSFHDHHTIFLNDLGLLRIPPFKPVKWLLFYSSSIILHN